MSYIEFKNITKKYGDNTVLRNVSLNVEQGDLVTLLGPSGCGKSTLLRCLSGLESVTEGSIFLGGEDITNVPPKDRKIGMVFQQYSLFPNMNVFENIAFGLRMQKLAPAVIAEKVERVIAIVDLVGKEKSMPHQLSGGQQQRVALARSIVTEPKVLLLDEPLSAIDAKLRKSLQQEIRNIQQKMQITTLFVTHDQDEAMIMSDVIHLMYQGNVEQSGSPMDVYTNPKTPFAASFIGNYNLLNSYAFRGLVQQAVPATAQFAIRPETVELSNDYIAQKDCYQFTAIISGATNRGNVIRYTLSVGEHTIMSDQLFRTKALHNVGDTVQVSIQHHNCIVFA